MASIYDQPAPIPQGPTPETPPAQSPSLVDQWSNYMVNERNRAMMMQFGLNMMQPMAPGQNFIGHLGQSIGSAGEAGDRYTSGEIARRKQETSEEDVGSKVQLRGAQAETAEARANTAATRAGAAADRLSATRENAALAARVRLQGMYASDVARIRKANDERALLNPTAPKDNVPTFEEWLGKNQGLADALGNGGGATVPTSRGGESPPVQGAVKAPDGRWVVQRDGKWFEVR